MSVYHSPKDHGLYVVVEVELAEADYSFNLLVVWKHKDTGDLYWATDSGCSCPSPFEDYGSIEQLDKLDDLRAIELELKESSWVQPSERRDVMAQIMEAYVG